MVPDVRIAYDCHSVLTRARELSLRFHGAEQRPVRIGEWGIGWDGWSLVVVRGVSQSEDRMGGAKAN